MNTQSQKFRFYKKGIIDWADCGEEGTHAVLAVGYGKDKKTGKEYFIIKNSWGEQWGENGFARILNS